MSHLFLGVRAFLSKSSQEAWQSKAVWVAHLPVRTCDRDRRQLEVMTYALREDNLVDDLGEYFLTRKPEMNFRFFGVAVKRRKTSSPVPSAHTYPPLIFPNPHETHPIHFSSSLHPLCEPFYR